ncbi:MAG TPA: hypothetical protein VHN14_02070, partial [Kofleriaceae bacterium]|nr:hypothetical protein [Kofleriaceae bacterium]
MSSPDDNYFYINFGNGVSSMTFTYNNDLQVTSGEDKGSVVVTVETNQIKIDAQADRKGSTSVADWFNNNIANQASHAVTITAIGDDLPEELNFAFSGTLNINGDQYTLYIGQGHNLGGNPWWIGCNNLDDGLLGTGYQVVMTSNATCTIGWASGVSANTVSLTGASGMITAISYNNDLHITDDVPYTGVSVDTSSFTNIIITVDADRKASTDVAT